MEHVTWGSFDELKKPDLMTLAKSLNLDVKHAIRKQEIKNILIDHLVDDDVWDGFCLDHKVLIDDGTDNAVKLKQLEIQKEMELARLQLEQERLKIEENRQSPFL